MGVINLSKRSYVWSVKKTELLPCPRCANNHIHPKAKLIEVEGKQRWIVKCGDRRCGYHTKLCFVTEDLARLNWNTTKRIPAKSLERR